MGKKEEIEDILGEKGDKKPAKTAKKTPAKAEKPAKEAKPAAKKAKPAAEPATPKKADKKAKPAAEAKPARVREPVEFDDGEKDKLAKAVGKALVKAGKPGIVSKDLAVALGIKTRKLRAVLYSMERAGEVKLKPGASRAAGMTVTAA